MKFPWLRKQREEELDAEIRSHLDEAIRDRIARGESPEQARANALREFGNVGLVKEVTREMWGWASLERLLQDLRFGLRMLRKNPGFSLVAILTLALGIGANTAIFSVVNAVLLRPLPYQNSAELMLIRHLYKTTGSQGQSVSYPDVQDWRVQNNVFADVAIFRANGFSLALGNDIELIRGANASANFFSLLGVNAFRGRTFAPTEETISGDRVTVLSHALWQSRFGGDEKLPGQAIKLSNEAYTVIGILPPDFKFPFGLEQAEIWTTNAGLPAGMLGRGARNFQAFARLKPGVSLLSAQTEMAGIAARLEQANPGTNRNLSLALVGMQELLTKEIRTTLWLLFGAVGFVLLIACANVANLLLARALARQKELAVRAALGASGWRIARQLLTESLLLSLTGGALGVWLAAWGIQLLMKLSPPNLPRVNAVGLNGQALCFTFVVAVLTGIFFGLVPAWTAARPSLPDLHAALKEGGKSSASGGSQWLRSVLVVGEIALALLLLIGAALLINSFIRLNRVELGFNPNQVLTAPLSLPEADYRTEAEQIAFVRRAQEEIRRLPAVRSISFASSLPFEGGITSAFSLKGHERSANMPSLMTGVFFVMPDYLTTMGMQLLQGRAFTDADDQRSAGAVIVNEAFAQQFLPQGNPLGQRISSFANLNKKSPQEFEIVGVVANARGAALDKEPRPEMFVPYLQVPQSFGSLTILAERDALSLAGAVRQRIRSLDAAQTVPRMNTIENRIADSILPQRFNLLLLSIFAGVGLVLTLVGIYGVMSYHVTSRTHEIGIRMALGAQTGDVLKLVLRQGTALTVLGLAIGLAAAFSLTRLITTLLFGVSATDPLTFAVITLLLLLVSLCACWIPARRATKVDPLIALRHE
ncbi:MAG: ADOP family duplicated permease [Blastocatellia bacterium]